MEMTSVLTKFEMDVVVKCLDGDHPVLEQLRSQLRCCTVAKRELTGVGLYCWLAIEHVVGTFAGTFEISDVCVDEVEGLDHGIGCVLWIERGRIALLEAFTYDEPWPSSITKYRLSYLNEKRDMSKIIRALG